MNKIHSFRENLSLICGSIGLFFPIIAIFISDPTLKASFFLIGSLILTLTAFIQDDRYFIYLQIIVLSGAIAYFLPIQANFRAFIPLILVFLFSGNLLRFSAYQTPWALFGILGMTNLGVGYALAFPLIYLIGGVSIALYSFHRYQAGNRPALIWFILNTVFSLSILSQLLYQG